MNEYKIIDGLKARDILAFKELVMQYSEDMLIAAYSLTNSANRANRLVWEILLRIRADGPADMQPPIYPYLRKQIQEAAVLGELIQV